MLTDISRGLIPKLHLDTNLINKFELWVYHSNAAAEVLDECPQLEALLLGIQVRDPQAIVRAAFVDMDQTEG